MKMRVMGLQLYHLTQLWGYSDVKGVFSASVGSSLKYLTSSQPHTVAIALLPPELFQHQKFCSLGQSVAAQWTVKSMSTHFLRSLGTTANCPCQLLLECFMHLRDGRKQWKPDNVSAHNGSSQVSGHSSAHIFDNYTWNCIWNAKWNHGSIRALSFFEAPFIWSQIRRRQVTERTLLSFN